MIFLSNSLDRYNQGGSYYYLIYCTIVIPNIRWSEGFTEQRMRNAAKSFNGFAEQSTRNPATSFSGGTVNKLRVARIKRFVGFNTGTLEEQPCTLRETNETGRAQWLSISPEPPQTFRFYLSNVTLTLVCRVRLEDGTASGQAVQLTVHSEVGKHTILWRGNKGVEASRDGFLSNVNISKGFDNYRMKETSSCLRYQRLQADISPQTTIDGNVSCCGGGADTGEITDCMEIPLIVKHPPGDVQLNLLTNNDVAFLDVSNPESPTLVLTDEGAVALSCEGYVGTDGRLEFTIKTIIKNYKFVVNESSVIEQNDLPDWVLLCNVSIIEVENKGLFVNATFELTGSTNVTGYKMECLAGWSDFFYRDVWREILNKSCSRGTYGELCSYRCSEFCLNLVCDKLTGRCKECKDNKIGVFCEYDKEMPVVTKNRDDEFTMFSIDLTLIAVLFLVFALVVFTSLESDTIQANSEVVLKEEEGGVVELQKVKVVKAEPQSNAKSENTNTLSGKRKRKRSSSKHKTAPETPTRLELVAENLNTLSGKRKRKRSSGKHKTAPEMPTRPEVVAGRKLARSLTSARETFEAKGHSLWGNSSRK